MVEENTMESTGPFAKSLGSNDKETRDKTLKALKTFLRRNKGSALPEFESLKLWKGLFYCMWMSDKIPVQQELAENIASLLPLFEDIEPTHAFIETFFLTMQREWPGVDHLRLDKFYSLMRRFQFQWFTFLHSVGWKKSAMAAYKRIMTDVVLKRKPESIRSHIIDVFVPELERLASQSEKIKITSTCLNELLEPFYVILQQGKDSTMNPSLYNHTIKQVFSSLITTSKFELKSFDINLYKISQKIWDICSEATTISDRQRSLLYGLHGELKSASITQGTYSDKRPSGKEVPSKRKKSSPELKGRGDENDRFKESSNVSKETNADVESPKERNGRKLKSPKKKKKGSKGIPAANAVEIKDAKEEKPVSGVKKNKARKRKRKSLPAEINKIKSSQVDEAKITPIKSPGGRGEMSKRIRFSEYSAVKTYSLSVKGLRTTPIKSSAEQNPPSSGLLRRTEPKKSKPQRVGLKKGLAQARKNAFRNAARSTPVRVNLAPWSL